MSREAMRQALDALKDLNEQCRLQGLALPAEIDAAMDALHAALAEKPEPVSLPCCGYSNSSAVMWNQYNKVVQCHNCGQVYNAAPPGYVMVPKEIMWTAINRLRWLNEQNIADQLRKCFDCMAVKGGA